MMEDKRRRVCRQIAEDMYVAGMGWHEDALLRFTAAPLRVVAASTYGVLGRRASQFQHRSRLTAWHRYHPMEEGE